MTLNDDLLKGIDSLVEKLVENGVVSHHKQLSDIESKAIRFLKSKNWIKLSTKPSQYHPTDEIYEIRKVGIKEYLKENDRIKALELDIKELTVKNLELQNKQLKRTVVYSIIGFISGAIVTNLKDILILLNIMTPE